MGRLWASDLSAAGAANEPHKRLYGGPLLRQGEPPFGVERRRRRHAISRRGLHIQQDRTDVAKVSVGSRPRARAMYLLVGIRRVQVERLTGRPKRRSGCRSWKPASPAARVGTVVITTEPQCEKVLGDRCGRSPQSDCAGDRRQALAPRGRGRERPVKGRQGSSVRARTAGRRVPITEDRLAAGRSNRRTGFAATPRRPSSFDAIGVGRTVAIARPRPLRA